MTSSVGKRNKMKLDKDLLKSIVKECLVEILAEGIVNTQAPVSSKKRSLSESINNSPRRENLSGRHASNQSQQQRRNYLDNISYGNSSEKNSRHDNAVSRITKSITKDAVMQDILADTARTTLQEQVSGEPSRGAAPAMATRPADKAAEIVSNNEPEQIFGESAKNWATLAFS